MVYPVNEAFRREVRERALEVARRLTVERGWQQVRFVEVADEVGVSRPTMYSEFGNKAGLGEALVLAETDTFLTGLLATLADESANLNSAAKAALRYTMLAASENPLLHGVLTNAGDRDLLRLLTSKSGPVLPIAVTVLTDWFREHFPQVPEPIFGELIEALVRLTLSHLTQPTHELPEALSSLERITDLVLRTALD
ncbi:MAG TPA: TetR family transcriptional regulator [Jatrophihabitans sp.]|nr:TetR family transcriptional regulator [Jatrophihabitans sp.]